MPIYEYSCLSGHVTEAIRPVKDHALNIECPECGAPASKILSATPTSFRFADSSGRKRSRSNSQDIVRNVDNFKSPIDGTVITSERALKEHMRKHDVVPFEPSTKRKSYMKDKEEKQHRIAALRDAYEHNRDKSRYSRY